MILTLIVSLGILTSTPSTPKTNIVPKQTAFLFQDQRAVYNIPDKKKGRK